MVSPGDFCILTKKLTVCFLYIKMEPKDMSKGGDENKPSEVHEYFLQN